MQHNSTAPGLTRFIMSDIFLKVRPCERLRTSRDIASHRPRDGDYPGLDRRCFPASRAPRLAAHLAFLPYGAPEFADAEVVGHRSAEEKLSDGASSERVVGRIK